MFLVFAGRDKCSGGWKDLKQSFYDEEIAVRYAKRLLAEDNDLADWAHVVDLENNEIVWQW